jgi:hypothetical protein
MMTTAVEIGLALAAIAATGAIIIRILDNYRETGRKKK